jgi:hypothetical protein
LIAPYESNPNNWLKLKWVDQYSGEKFNITTQNGLQSRSTAQVKDYEEVMVEYEFHPESKCADADGKASTKQTEGLLKRRHVVIDQIRYIGKESNRLEEVESGTIHSSSEAYTEHTDLRRDEWQTKIIPALKKTSVRLLVKETQISRRTIISARNGHTRPHRRNQLRLAAALKKLGIT